MPVSQEDGLREQIGRMLAGGLETRREPLLENDVQIGELLAELRSVDVQDLKSKLVIAGFSDEPRGEDRMRCLECMYYLVHRKWCALPELAIPVASHWWCRFWRI